MESPPPSVAKVGRLTIEKAVNALLEWKQSQPQVQKPRDFFIYLNLTLKKIPPKTHTNAFRIPFPHPLHDAASSELCLIIDDTPNSKLTLDAARKIIQSQNIPITKVIDLSDLKTNYKTFEAKRKLCNSYDINLVDRRIVHLLPKLLGKQFFKRRKMPLPLDLTHKNWKEQVDRACGPGLFYLRTGTCVMRVGKGSMESEWIVDNVVEAIQGVVQVVPKNWDGVRSLHLRVFGSLYQLFPEIKLMIQGIKENEDEDRGDKVSGGLVDSGDDAENVANNAEEEGSDEEMETVDYEVDKVKKGKAEKISIPSESKGEKKAKELKKPKEQKKSKLSFKEGKKNKSTEREKKLKDGSPKAKSKRSKIRAYTY